MAKEKLAQAAVVGIKVFKVTKTLRVQLTEPEILAAAKKASDLYDKMTSCENDGKAAHKTFKERLDELTAQHDQSHSLVRNGYDFCPVDCEEKFDRNIGKVTMTRLDTREVIDEWAMTAEERQGKLFDEAAGE